VEERAEMERFEPLPPPLGVELRLRARAVEIR
jgi:hypothetical protein